MKTEKKTWKKTRFVPGIEPTGIITSFTGNYPDGYRFGGEMHDFWELVLVRGGSVWVAEEQKILNLGRNMFIVHKPMAFHRLWCSGSDTSVKIITFEAKGGMLKRLEGLSGTCPWQLADFLSQTIDFGHTLLHDRLGSEERDELSGRVKARLTAILYEFAELERTDEGVHETTDAERILATINEHYLEDISLETLATFCRMSESKIKKDFRSIYDGGVMKYICRLKMRDAAVMLSEGKSTDEICEALSIHDKNYFSFVFRREVGVTPSEYRRHHTTKEIEL